MPVAQVSNQAANFKVHLQQWAQS